MADPRIRQIKIKTGIVKRLVKDKMMYTKEASLQEEKVEKIKAEAGCEHVIRKQLEVLQESRMMIPDCQRRLSIAHGELQQLLETQEVRLALPLPPTPSPSITHWETHTHTHTPPHTRTHTVPHHSSLAVLSPQWPL
ncbi:tubulin-specific chaperone A isoform X1 [Hypomesus transpacificus]|uniref:tubulin-specific chaperone A isoform X1 n=1 Tax=Hypomesus transpacificus TaxID=137520 RepID=UPI001F084FE4|nr:tubulin-specific chaperone A isoform X1 [Hypomesus transpacificus]